jgi:hypothetical protein
MLESLSDVQHRGARIWHFEPEIRHSVLYGRIAAKSIHQMIVVHDTASDPG